ncbi:hypothetical protein BV25DRAFT_1988107 [Artomyces pyxidatus]|uniref:Uncharacterized protein n=1 Tax=Artomyces pyxidatus TaxID=48021 RepID=A0ACB8TF34_9AGAM|nr:hypothetical protein BV25DRAFT_1988107 [Artomyces pyxidatus]
MALTPSSPRGNQASPTRLAFQALSIAGDRTDSNRPDPPDPHALDTSFDPPSTPGRRKKRKRSQEDRAVLTPVKEEQEDGPPAQAQQPFARLNAVIDDILRRAEEQDFLRH